jgi:hypothetical protein
MTFGEAWYLAVVADCATSYDVMTGLPKVGAKVEFRVGSAIGDEGDQAAIGRPGRLDIVVIAVGDLARLGLGTIYVDDEEMVAPIDVAVAVEARERRALPAQARLLIVGVLMCLKPGRLRRHLLAVGFDRRRVAELASVR